MSKETLEAKYENLEFKIEERLKNGDDVEEMRAELDRLAVEIWGQVRMTKSDKRKKGLFLSFAKRRHLEFNQTPKETYQELLDGEGLSGPGWEYE